MRKRKASFNLNDLNDLNEDVDEKDTRHPKHARTDGSLSSSSTTDNRTDDDVQMKEDDHQQEKEQDEEEELWSIVQLDPESSDDDERDFETFEGNNIADQKSGSFLPSDYLPVPQVPFETTIPPSFQIKHHDKKAEKQSIWPQAAGLGGSIWSIVAEYAFDDLVDYMAERSIAEGTIVQLLQTIPYTCWLKRKDLAGLIGVVMQFVHRNQWVALFTLLERLPNLAKWTDPIDKRKSWKTRLLYHLVVDNWSLQTSHEIGWMCQRLQITAEHAKANRDQILRQLCYDASMEAIEWFVTHFQVRLVDLCCEQKRTGILLQKAIVRSHSPQKSIRLIERLGLLKRHVQHWIADALYLIYKLTRDFSFGEWAFKYFQLDTSTGCDLGLLQLAAGYNDVNVLEWLTKTCNIDWAERVIYRTQLEIAVKFTSVDASKWIIAKVGHYEPQMLLETCRGSSVELVKFVIDTFQLKREDVLFDDFAIFYASLSHEPVGEWLRSYFGVRLEKVPAHSYYQRTVFSLV